MTEPVVLGSDDARLGEAPLHELARAVRRRVVDDHDVGLHVSEVCEQRGQTRLEPVRLVRRHDDDGDVVHVWSNATAPLVGGRRTSSPRERARPRASTGEISSRAEPASDAPFAAAHDAVEDDRVASDVDHATGAVVDDPVHPLLDDARPAAEGQHLPVEAQPAVESVRRRAWERSPRAAGSSRRRPAGDSARSLGFVLVPSPVSGTGPISRVRVATSITNARTRSGRKPEQSVVSALDLAPVLPEISDLERSARLRAPRSPGISRPRRSRRRARDASSCRPRQSCSSAASPSASVGGDVVSDAPSTRPQPRFLPVDAAAGLTSVVTRSRRSAGRPGRRCPSFAGCPCPRSCRRSSRPGGSP